MPKFTMDYSHLDKSSKKFYKLSDIKDQLETVAFDIVKFKDNDKSADLWQVQSADDGEYIVALYQPEENTEKSASWEVTVTKNAMLQIYYKDYPIVRLAASKIGIPANELGQVPQYLPAKLSTNKKLVTALLSEVSTETKQQILQKYPELG